ncbi:MAG: hypothetical protein EXR75_02045 [Myxococcales bacterium]|nr:hypothetical protein [Myxococcales bacterium]
MVRQARLMAAAGWLAVTSCATYRDDLDRARARYEKNEYGHAIALLDVLNHDIDSLSEAERAQFAYVQGMSHYRLGHKRHARHWLAVALAREKAAQGSLKPDEKLRAVDLMSQLNVAWWGGESALEQPAACKRDEDCKRGEFCEASACAKAGAAQKATRSNGAGDEAAIGDSD